MNTNSCILNNSPKFLKNCLIVLIILQHGVFIGASCKSEATAAAEHKGKVIMHDPFSMRPFFGYNFGYSTSCFR